MMSGGRGPRGGCPLPEGANVDYPHSSFLKLAFRAGERYGVSGAHILLRCGERKLVGGQEDQIIDIASELAAERAAIT